MKLTKDQRFTAYCIMLQEMEEINGGFFCNVIHSTFSIERFSFEINRHRNIFPELYRKRPKENLIGDVWYHEFGYGHKIRIKDLTACILETHP